MVTPWIFSERAQPYSQDDNSRGPRQRHLTSAIDDVWNDIKLPDTQVLKTQESEVSHSNSSSLIPMRHTLTSQVSPLYVQQDIPSSIPSPFATNYIRPREP